MTTWEHKRNRSSTMVRHLLAEFGRRMKTWKTKQERYGGVAKKPMLDISDEVSYYICLIPVF